MERLRKRQKRYVIPKNMSTALPLVSTSVPLVNNVLPRMGAEIPLVTKKIGLVSGRVPLVSAHIPKSLPRHWGFLPSRSWGKTGLPAERKREVARPTDIGLFHFLGKVLTPTQQLLRSVANVGNVVDSQIPAKLKFSKSRQALLEKELKELKK